MRRKGIKHEAGFTLTEVLVTILMMSLVVMALYSMFDMSLRVFSLGNSTVETNENARVALDRMEREIRSAWPSTDSCSNPDSSPDQLVRGTITPVSISFRNCLNNPAEPEEEPPVLTEISYSVSGKSLIRTEEVAGVSESETLATLGSSGDLAFEYFASDQTFGDEPTDATVLVEITLVTSDTDGSGRVQTQRLVTSAGLRNAKITSDED